MRLSVEVRGFFLRSDEQHNMSGSTDIYLLEVPEANLDAVAAAAAADGYLRGKRVLQRDDGDLARDCIIPWHAIIRLEPVG